MKYQKLFIQSAVVVMTLIMAGCPTDSRPSDPKMTGPINKDYLWQAWEIEDSEDGKLVDLYIKMYGDSIVPPTPYRKRFMCPSKSDTCFLAVSEDFYFGAIDTRISYPADSELTVITTGFGHGINRYPITKLTPDKLIYRNFSVYVINTPARNKVLVDTTYGKYEIMWPKP